MLWLEWSEQLNIAGGRVTWSIYFGRVGFTKQSWRMHIPCGRVYKQTLDHWFSKYSLELKGSFREVCEVKTIFKIVLRYCFLFHSHSHLTVKVSSIRVWYCNKSECRSRCKKSVFIKSVKSCDKNVQQCHIFH